MKIEGGLVIKSKSFDFRHQYWVRVPVIVVPSPRSAVQEPNRYASSAPGTSTLKPVCVCPASIPMASSSSGVAHSNAILSFSSSVMTLADQPCGDVTLLEGRPVKKSHILGASVSC